MREGALNTDNDIRGFISQYSQYSRYYPQLAEDKLDVFKENMEYMAKHDEPIIVGDGYLLFAVCYKLLKKIMQYIQLFYVDMI